MKTIKIKNIDSLHSAASQFLSEIGDNRIIAFYGAMGAGKTTFTKAICDVLGVKDTVNSPTFAIVNEYTAGNGEPVYHFDFYRIKRIEEIFDFGYENYVDSGYFCLMEWPEMIEPVLPEDAIKVTVIEMEDGSREVRF